MSKLWLSSRIIVDTDHYLIKLSLICKYPINDLALISETPYAQIDTTVRTKICKRITSAEENFQ